MSSAYFKSTVRTVAASFVAGVGAMALVGLVTPVAMKGGLSLNDAAASETVRRTQLIEPLDLEAVQAQLAAAERSVEAAKARTVRDLAELERLTQR